MIGFQESQAHDGLRKPATGGTNAPRSTPSLHALHNQPDVAYTSSRMAVNRTEVAEERRVPEARAAPRAFTAAALLAGLVVSAVMVARAQVGGDQLHILSRGWLLAARGVLVHVGTPTSAGGDAPGDFTGLLVGAPLLVWMDYRATAVPVVLFHLAAWLLLDGLLRRTVGARERVLFLVLYWLNPWRLYFSGHVWDPNYLFLFGALHAVTAYASRERPRFWPSFLHVLAIGLAFQLHASASVLLIASALLVWRRYLHPSWAGVTVAAAVLAASLVPWALLALHDPAILPGHKGFPLRGLVANLLVPRGPLLLLRYASFALPGRMTDFDFTSTLGAGVDAWLGRPLHDLVDVVVGPLSLVLPGLGQLWFWRTHGGQLARQSVPRASGRSWLIGYTAWTLVAAVVSFAVSPTTVMMWQALIVLHAAVIPVACPMYRRGGWKALTASMGHDHPMLHDLKIDRTATVTIDPSVTWWPDVLPRN